MINGRQHRTIQRAHPALLSELHTETLKLPVSEVRRDGRLSYFKTTFHKTDAP